MFNSLKINLLLSWNSKYINLITLIWTNKRLNSPSLFRICLCWIVLIQITEKWNIETHNWLKLFYRNYQFFWSSISWRYIWTEHCKTYDFDINLSYLNCYIQSFLERLKLRIDYPLRNDSETIKPLNPSQK